MSSSSNPTVRLGDVRDRSPSLSLRWGLAATAAATAVVVYGVYGDPHAKADQQSGLPFVIIVLLAVAAMIFGVVVRRTLRTRDRLDTLTARPGLAMSAVGLVLVPVAFWSGIPLVLGVGGSLVGSQARRIALSGDGATGPATAAVIVGVLAAVTTVLMVVLGNTLLSS